MGDLPGVVVVDEDHGGARPYRQCFALGFEPVVEDERGDGHRTEHVDLEVVEPVTEVFDTAEAFFF